MATLYLMAGPAGSGKSYVINSHEEYKNLPVVNADTFKENHPEYNPKNPSALHEWSSIQAQREFYKMLSSGEDFIYDGTATKAEKYVKMIKDANSAGFKVELVYVKVSLQTSLQRNANRERQVPEFIVREQHSLIDVAISILANHADSIKIIKND